MRSKEEIQKEVSGSYTIEGCKGYSHDGKGISANNLDHANEYLFLEVLIDIRDQLSEVTSAIKGEK